MEFTLISDIDDIENIAVGSSIRDIEALREEYGGRRWRKLKGVAYVELEDGSVVFAELHWYECSGIGRRRMKIKRYLEEI